MIFQSTLPREERLKKVKTAVKHHNFNPRSHERSDEFDIYCGTDYNISIHAPTRGAT